MVYGMEGLSREDVMDMDAIERRWWLNRLYKQLKKEASMLPKVKKGRR